MTGHRLHEKLGIRKIPCCQIVIQLLVFDSVHSNLKNNPDTSRPTVCVTGAGAGVDSAWEQKKLEARKMLENAAESPASSARFVSLLLCFFCTLFCNTLLLLLGLICTHLECCCSNLLHHLGRDQALFEH